jgi:hypothetical protein
LIAADCSVASAAFELVGSAAAVLGDGVPDVAPHLCKLQSLAIAHFIKTKKSQHNKSAIAAIDSYYDAKGQVLTRW